MALIVKIKKNKKQPCKDCAFKSTGSCKKDVKCKDYTPVTPTCSNCGEKIHCKNAGRVRRCKKWEPDQNSPFISLIKELSEIRNSKTSSAVSLLDDRDFKQAPNFITFCLDHLQIHPFPKQIEEGSFFFGDICFNCSNPAYQHLYSETLGDVLDNMVFLEHGKCPQCGKNRFELMKEFPDKMHWYQELVGVAGQRSGKSELAAQMSAYIWQWYTKLADNPSKFFGLLNTRLHMTFVALTYGQAKKNLWNPFYDYLKDSPWFTDFHKAIKERCQELGIENAIKFPDTFIVYKHKNLECAPVGPDKRVLRGPTRSLFAIDELGWFTGKKTSIKINPDEVYNALSNSLATIRGQSEHLRTLRGLYHIPTAYAINISSPSSARDKIMRLLYQSRKIKNMHAFHLPTWEMNPNLPRDNELFDTEFQKNPVHARRDFGAFPPLAESPFIAELGPIHEVASKKKNMFDYELVIIKSKSGKKYISVRLKRIIPRKRPILLGVDAGRSGNAFAIVATSYNNHGQAVLEGAIEVKPLPDLPVNFIDVYRHGLRPIIKTQTVIALLVDQWQSIDLVDKVDEEFGDDTEAIRYSLKYGDLEDARQRLLGEQVILPVPEVKSWKTILKGIEEYEEFFLNRPISHLYLQLATVQDSGRRVEKSGDLDDDLFRALMLCVRFTFDEKDGYKYELMALSNNMPYGSETIGIVRGKSMGDKIPIRMRPTVTLSRTSMGLVVGMSGKVPDISKKASRIPKK